MLLPLSSSQPVRHLEPRVVLLKCLSAHLRIFACLPFFSFLLGLFLYVKFYLTTADIKGFPRGAAVKKLSAKQETQGTGIWSLGQEDPLEQEMALQCSWLGSPMDRGTWWATVLGSQKVRHNWAHTHTHTHTHTHYRYSFDSSPSKTFSHLPSFISKTLHIIYCVFFLICFSTTPIGMREGVCCLYL